MRLIHWATLQPQGSSSLAAIRFSAPVIIRTLRIFGPNEPLFGNDLSILSETEYPESHEELVAIMRLMFTATPLAAQEMNDKPKPSNQLATTKINYDGGTRDFKIDMKSHSTRLMMLVTWLPKVTVAVYGDLFSELPTEDPTPASTSNINIAPTPLPRYLEVSSAQDPASLANSLCLEAVGEVTTLHLLRLMFLLKPADRDWDIPNYPAKYADIGTIPDLDPTEEQDLIHPKQRWLEHAMEELRFPVHDQESPDNIRLLAEPLAVALETPSIIKPAWLIHVIANLNQHPPIVAQIALAKVDMVVLVEDDLSSGGSLIEKMIICAANPSFANHLLKLPTMDRLRSLRSEGDSRQETLLTSLISRVEGWKVFEQSLEEGEIAFEQVTPWIYGILGDEESFAMFVQGLVSYEPVSKKLKAVPTSGSVKPLFSYCPNHVSITDRQCFIRAIVGVSSVLPIFCWANSEGKHHCLQRVIHAFLIWQTDPGYSEILNRVLSLKQCIWRLFMTVKDYTQGTSLGAERLLYQLYRSNTEVLFHPTFANYLSTRTDDWLPLSDDVWLAKATITAQQGMKGVLQLLFTEATTSEWFRDPNGVYLLRVLVEYLHREVCSGNEEVVFKVMWSSDPTLGGIVPTLVGYFMQIAKALHSERIFSSLPRVKQIMYSDLFTTAHHLLSLISHFGEILPPVSRIVDQLGKAFLSLQIACTMILTPSLASDSQLRSSARRARDSMVEALTSFKSDKLGSNSSARLLETLLLCSQYPSGDDPVAQFEAVTCVLDALLPGTQTGDTGIEELIWGRRVVGQLTLLRPFLQRAGRPKRARWILRLIGIDSGESGLDYALLSEEIVQLQLALDRLQEAESHQPLEHALQFEIATRFECLEALSKAQDFDLVARLIAGKLTEKLAKCYTSMSQLRIHSTSSVGLAKELVKSNQKHLRVAGICALLREARLDHRPLPDVIGILRNSGTFLGADIELLVIELGHNFSAMSTRPSLSPADARATVSLMEWLASSSKEAFIPTLTYNAFQALQKLVQEAIPDQASTLASLSTELHFGDDELMEDLFSSVLTVSNQGLTPAQIGLLIESQGQPRTPPRLASHPALGLVTTSPPSINRPLMSSHLTKTYLNNDFRQLRNSGSSRHNTSRPPSIHVDDFVAASSPLGTRSANSVNSQASAQSSPAIPHSSFASSFIPGLQ